jgi:hypothetical protein
LELRRQATQVAKEYERNLATNKLKKNIRD